MRISDVGILRQKKARARIRQERPMTDPQSAETERRQTIWGFLIALAVVVGSSDLKMPEPTKMPSSP